MPDFSTLSDSEFLSLDVLLPVLRLDTVTAEEEAQLRIPFRDRDYVQTQKKDCPHGRR